jgi:coenzyme F420-reducing hydrogenase gamma subunit
MSDMSEPPSGRRELPLPRQLWRWWRLRSRRGLLVTGALPSSAAVDFVERLKAGAVLPLPLDAERPDDADVVLVVGRVSLKLALALAPLRQRLPHGALVVAIDEAPLPLYAAGPATDVLAVDLFVPGLPPPPAAIDALVRRLLPRPGRAVAP